MGKNLGELTGSLLLFGGPYSNFQATESLQRCAEQLDIPASNIICTGDVVAYCAQPNETIALLRDWGIQVVMGNCEESLATDATDCGCGFEKDSACDVLTDSWYPFAVQSVDAQHKRWMRNLPRSLRFNYCGKSFLVVHGGVERINQFIYASTDAAEKQGQIEREGVDGIIAGHSGLPFTQQFDGLLWHNPGVIGMPANDGASHGWYSLWYCESEKIRIEHHQLRYDDKLAQQKMYSAGLNNGYADALSSGLWPSMDVLPTAERKQRGFRIAESVIIY